LATIEINEAAAALADYARRAGTEPVILTEGGKPLAALVSLEGVDAETLALATSPRFMAIVQESRESLRAEGGLSSDDVRRELGVKPRRRR
jgi:antitoxin (DNA-binding transcriptional repressor) of toxin-antitoxin stability system